MQQKTSEKLLCGDGHQPLLAFPCVIFPAESDLAVGKVHDPVVGNSDTMRVTSQILQDVLRSSERPFRVNDPVIPIQRPEESVESFPFSQRFQIAGKRSLPRRNARLRPAMNLPRKTRLSTFTGRKNG
jgi:hypothetical protein